MSICDRHGEQLAADEWIGSGMEPEPPAVLDPTEAASALQWDAALAAERGSDRAACFALFRLACWLQENPERAAAARAAGAL